MDLLIYGLALLGLISGIDAIFNMIDAQKYGNLWCWLFLTLGVLYWIGTIIESFFNKRRDRG